jgi:hypothetical protein
VLTCKINRAATRLINLAPTRAIWPALLLAVSTVCTVASPARADGNTAANLEPRCTSAGANQPARNCAEEQKLVPAAHLSLASSASGTARASNAVQSERPRW